MLLILTAERVCHVGMPGEVRGGAGPRRGQLGTGRSWKCDMLRCPTRRAATAETDPLSSEGESSYMAMGQY